jgi:hypothetical protein
VQFAVKAHPNKDVAWLHRPSRTLVEADLLFTKTTAEQQATGGLFGMLTGKFGPGTGLHKTMVSGFAKADKACAPPPRSTCDCDFAGDLLALLTSLWHTLSGFTAASKMVAAWDFDRLIPCHGEVIETGAKTAWTSTYADLLQ